MNVPETPSKELVLQRVRNRIIEYFDLVADPEAQEQFGADSVINYWQDWQVESFVATYPDPTFNASERKAMAAFESAWQIAANSTSNPMPSIEALRNEPPWLSLCAAAQHALAVFLVRGLLPEN